MRLWDNKIVRGGVSPNTNNWEWSKGLARKLHEIAEEISRDWKKPYFGAVPYVEAMRELSGIGDKYYSDDAKSVVLYFLSNAATWRGPVAKRVKAELKEMCK